MTNIALFVLLQVAGTDPQPNIPVITIDPQTERRLERRIAQSRRARDISRIVRYSARAEFAALTKIEFTDHRESPLADLNMYRMRVHAEARRYAQDRTMTARIEWLMAKERKVVAWKTQIQAEADQSIALVKLFKNAIDMRSKPVIATVPAVDPRLVEAKAERYIASNQTQSKHDDAKVIADFPHLTFITLILIAIGGLSISAILAIRRRRAPVSSAVRIVRQEETPPPLLAPPSLQRLPFVPRLVPMGEDRPSSSGSLPGEFDLLRREKVVLEERLQKVQKEHAIAEGGHQRTLREAGASAAREIDTLTNQLSVERVRRENLAEQLTTTEAKLLNKDGEADFYRTRAKALGKENEKIRTQFNDFVSNTNRAESSAERRLEGQQELLAEFTRYERERDEAEARAILVADERDEAYARIAVLEAQIAEGLHSKDAPTQVTGGSMHSTLLRLVEPGAPDSARFRESTNGTAAVPSPQLYRCHRCPAFLTVEDLARHIVEAHLDNEQLTEIEFADLFEKSGPGFTLCPRDHTAFPIGRGDEHRASETHRSHVKSV
jgi:hypothetical protein